VTTVPTREEYFARWAELHGDYHPSSNWMVRFWLSVIYTLARPLAVLRIPPDVITVGGGVLTAVAVWVAALGDRWVLLASALILLTGIVDNLDGAVAVLSDRATDFGYVLDSVVDRVSDVLYVVAFWALGAPGWLCVTGAVLAGLQEYARARAAAVGMSEIGVVTPSERPTRVLVTAMFLLGAGIYTSAAVGWATAGAATYAVASAVGLTLVLIGIWRRLR
jgi:CDP-diacylglycerol--glycerol-3-phosphate 3-phosphatidyltransferase